MIDYMDLIKSKKCFPVICLNNQIIEKLEELNSIGIRTLLQEGLKKIIDFNEFNGPIKVPAEINSLNSIKISIAYCQFLWGISYVALNVYDCNIIQNELRKNPTLKDDLIKEYEKAKNELGEEDCLRELRAANYVNKYLDESKVFKDCYKVFERGLSLLNKEVTDFTEFYDIPNVLYESNEKVNGIYLYAVLFILIHEISHFSLGHVESTTENEYAADSGAFWTLNADLNDTEKTSANIGILTALCSLLFFSKNLDGGNSHPDNDDRIIATLENIIDGNNHYLGFVITIFKMWAYVYDIEEIEELNSKSINSNMEYLSEILKICQNFKKRL